MAKCENSSLITLIRLFVFQVEEFPLGEFYLQPADKGQAVVRVSAFMAGLELNGVILSRSWTCLPNSIETERSFRGEAGTGSQH